MSEAMEQGTPTEQAIAAASNPGGHDVLLQSLGAQLELLRQTFESSLSSLQERIERLEALRSDEGLGGVLGLEGDQDEAKLRRELDDTRRKLQRMERQQAVAPYLQRALGAFGFTGTEPDLYRPSPKAWEENPEVEALKMVVSAAEAAANRWRMYLMRQLQQQQQGGQPSQAAPQFETERPGAETGSPSIIERLRSMPRSQFNRAADFLVRRAWKGEEVKPEDILAHL